MIKWAVVPVVVAACCLALPSIRNSSRFYWGSLALTSAVVLAGAVIASAGPVWQTNAPLSVAACFIVFPIALAYVGCSASWFRRHPAYLALCAPLFYAVGLVLGANVGMLLGLLEH